MVTDMPISEVSLNEVKLVNQDYHATIIAPLLEREAKGEYPTVRHLVRSMRQLGNGAYYDAFPELKRKRQESFGPNDLAHELAHLTCKLGHTPQQEVNVLYFLEGLKLESGAATIEERQRSDLRDKERGWRHTGLEYQDRISDPASARDRAVYYAAGMYLRQKFEEYLWQGVPSDPDAEARRKFCVDYANPAYKPPAPHFTEDLFAEHLVALESAPYQLALLSGEGLDHRDRRLTSGWLKAEKAKQHGRERMTTRPDMHGRGEWASIEAVATGLCTPEQTDYPERLRPIQQALTDLGLLQKAAASMEKGDGNQR